MHSEKPTLILKRASKSRVSGQWPDNDYDVFDGDHLIGRIRLQPQAPPGQVARLRFWRAGHSRPARRI
jgi:hypothetical protein